MNPSLPNIPGYDVEAELGRGGMGVVYRVRRRTNGAILALKMILCGREASFQELARFRIEAEAMACLNHPNIIKIRDVGVFSGYPFIALDFAERGNLKQVLQGKPQLATSSAGLVKTLALAMEHAHGRGMLHRDLKPANVLVFADGTPKISDFGLVKFCAPISQISEACCTISVSILDVELERFSRELAFQYKSIPDATEADPNEITRGFWQDCATRTGALSRDTSLQSVIEFLEQARQQVEVSPCLDDLTNAGAVMGSPSYMAPEQASGDLGKIGPPTDIYALGGILYELLTGQPPFSSRNFHHAITAILSQPPLPPHQIDPKIPPEIEAICLKCLEKDPRKRYPKASVLADDLQNFIDNFSPLSFQQKSSENTTANDSTEWPNRVVSTRSEDHGTGSGENEATRSWWPFRRDSKLRKRPGRPTA